MTGGNARVYQMERVAAKHAYALHGTLVRGKVTPGVN